jgi:MerR family copper efflux transcriptional regulator
VACGEYPSAVAKIPIACTLSADERVDRRGEWSEMLGRAATRELRDTGAHLTFAPDPGVAAELADLAAREVDCCAFFTFMLTVTHDGVGLDISAPTEAHELVKAFLAASSRSADRPA